MPLNELKEMVKLSFHEHPRDESILRKLEHFLEPGMHVLDCGCGDAALSKKIVKRFNVKITGLEIRPGISEDEEIVIMGFDGKKFPFKNNSFDSVLFVDVLHHTNNQKQLFEEAMRVAKDSVIIKDHYFNGFLSRQCLKAADFLGNRGKQMPMPCNYFSEKQWQEFLQGRDTKTIKWKSWVLPQIMAKVKVNK